MKHAILVLLAFLSGLMLQAQSGDSARRSLHFTGSVQATTNGIALIPTFSLGKPAVLAILSIGGERFSFDPDIRFDMEGKPWAMVFWTRYKLVNSSRYTLQIGPHLGMNFRDTDLYINGEASSNHVVRRYLASELSQQYAVGRNTSIGTYYLVSKGLDDGAVKQTHFVTVNASFKKIALSKQVFLQAFPQLYYLQQTDKKGFYFTSTIALLKKGFPLYLASTINKELSGDIPGSESFVWNLSVCYGINKRLRVER